MKRKLFHLAGACALLLTLACNDAQLTDPATAPSFAAAGQSLRDTDTNLQMPPDTTVELGDELHMALLAGNGNGPQNNKNVVWTSTDPAVVAITPDDGTVSALAIMAGSSTVCASLGGNDFCVVIHVFNPNTPPTPADDAFDAIGNVTVPVPAPGVLGNDTDAEQAVSAVPGVIATTNGGTVTMNADGSFTYLSPAGFNGSDSFSYQVTDGIDVASGNVTMTVSGRVWYAQNDAAAPGDGRDASPFTLLSDAEAASAVGETVFVLYGDGTSSGYDAGFTLKAGQSLVGQGIPSDVTITLNGATVTLLAAGSAPGITRAGAGATVVLASNNTLRGLDVASTAGAAVSGSGFGTFAADNTSLAAAGGPALDLTNGTAAASFTSASASSAANGIRLDAVSGSVSAAAGSLAATAAVVRVSGGSVALTYNGSLNAASGHATEVSGMNGGSVALGGNITAAAGGVYVHDNTATSVTLSGGSKALTAGSGSLPAVEIVNNNGAQVAFTNGGLAITTTDVAGFHAAGNAAGSVTVTGSGNTIASSGAPALAVQNTGIGAAGLIFESISADGGDNGIVLVNTGASGGLTVTGTGATGSGGTIQNMTGADGAQAGNGVWLVSTSDVSLSGMQLNDFSNHAVRGSNVNGFALNGSTANGAIGTSAALREGAVFLDGLSGTAQLSNTSLSGSIYDNLRIDNTAGSYTLNVSGSTFASAGNNGVSLISRGTAAATAALSGSHFTGNSATGFEATTESAGAMDVTVSGGSVQNNFVGINLAHASSGAFEFGVLNIPQITGQSSVPININRVAAPTATGLFSGTVSGNVIGTEGVAGSGSASGNGIRAVTNGVTGTLTVAITNNTVRELTFGRGIDVIARDGGTTLNATITGNDIELTAPFALEAIRMDAGAVSTDTVKVCADIDGNTAITNASSRGIRLRQRFLGTVFQLAGYAGGPTDNTAVASFLDANNTTSPGALADNGGPGFTGVGSCPQP